MAALEQSHPLSQGLTNQKVKASNVMRRGNQAVVLPHQRGFASMTNWLSKTYRFTFDEALKRDYNTAKAMQNDAFIQGLLRNRILPTAKSQWKIKATGPGASEEIERFYESSLKQIPLWHDFRRNLLMSVWHGRYGVQFATDSISHDYRKFYYQGRPINTISHWVPHSGDKITFTWDGVPGIRINAMYVSDWKTRYGATVLSPDDARLAREANSYRWTEEGPIMLLDTPEVRRKFAIPVFEVTDAPWDEPDMAGGVRGIGLRHYAFWCWDQRQEVVGWAMLHLEDFGAGGYTVIGYDGKEALQRNMAAFDNPETRVIHVPIIPGNDERITDQVTRLTPAGEGNDAIFQWAEQYFNAHLTILFTGHPLNSQAAPTGMGSEMAGKSTDILKSIQRSDAEVSDGSMTQEVLPVIQEANGHDPAQCQLEFISEIRESDKESGMKAAKAHFDMGGKVGKRYSHMLSDVPEVEDGEDYLQSPQFRQMEQQEALMAQGIMPTDEEGNPTQQAATPALNKGASKALKERGSQHASKLAGTFPAGKRVTLDEARQALAAQGVPDEDHLSAITWGVSTAAVIEHDEIDGVAYSRGPGAWPDSPVSYSTEGIDPASKWEAIPAPRSGGTRWRNIETGTITYVQPGAGRSVQGLPGDKESTGRKLDKAQGDTEDVALLPGKGIATSGVEQHITMLAEGGSKIAGEAGVLDAIRHVDKRLLKKQTVALAGRLGLGVSSRTSKTEALAYIEDTLRAKSKKPAGGTGTGADKATNQTAMTDLPGEGVTKGTPPTVSKEAPPRGGDKAEATVKGDDGVEYPAAAVTQDKAGNSFVTVPEGSGPVKSPVTGGTYRAGQKMPIARSAEFKKQAAGDQATDTTATVKPEQKQIGTDGDRATAEATYNAGLSKSPVPTDDDEEEAQAVTPAGAAAAASYEGDAAARDHAKRPREDGEGLKTYLKRIGKDEHHDSLRGYARSKHRQEKDNADYHNSAIKQAVEALAFEQGTKTFNMTKARKEGDYTSIPGFDTVAQSVATNHPGLFGGVDAGKTYEGEETGLAQDHAEKLWGMLTEGKKPYRTIREHEDAAIAEHHEAGWPSIEQDADDPRGAGEAQEPEDADTSFDFGGNKETQDMYGHGTTHSIEPRGNMRGFDVQFHDVGDDGKLGVSYKGGEVQTKIPKESAKHFVNDLNGTVDLPGNSGNAAVDAVAKGDAEHLGKGNDGIAFKVGDKVAKMSTTVPFQPFNPGHRTPDEAKQHIKKAVDVSNHLREAGVKNILHQEYIEHGDKAFSVMDYVKPAEKLTADQLRDVRETMDGIHNAGYVVGDEVQVGVKDGKAYIYDLGNAQPARTHHDIDDDSDRFERFADKMGHADSGPLKATSERKRKEHSESLELWGEDRPSYIDEYGDKLNKAHEANYGGSQSEATEAATGPTGMDTKPVEPAKAQEQGEETEESTMGREDGFMQQEEAGRWNESHIEGMAGQSFTNDKGLTVDLRKEDDGTWSVGSQKGLTQAGAAQHLNKIGAEPAQSLFGADVQAQGDTKKPAEKLQWSEPAKKKDDGAALPGMRDAFAPGMFGAAANQSDEQPKEIYEQVAEHFGIPPEAVKDALSTSFSKLQERDKAAEAIPSNHDEAPYTDYEKHELGTMRAANWNSNPKEAYVDYLTEHNPAELVTSEPEDGIKKSETYGKYAEWAKAGHEPPPISTSKSAKEGSKVVSSNRRRLLAAQEAGVEKIKAWHSPENPHTGNPLKYGDIIEHANSLGWEDPAAEQPNEKATPRGGEERVKLNDSQKAQAGEAYVNAYQGASGDAFDDHFEQAKDIKHMSAAELKEVASKINYPIAGKTREAMANELLRIALEKRGVSQRASMVRPDAKASSKSRHSLDDYQGKPTGKAAAKADLLKQAEALNIFGMKNKSVKEIQDAIDTVKSWHK